MNAIDLFCGCGGLSLGMQNAGINIVSSFDNWLPAIKCYEANFTHPIFNLDLTDHELISSKISEISMTQGLHIDLIVGGPPCQDFSQAGGRSEGARANLTASFARTISKIRPQYFIMENVDRALKSKAYSEAREIFVDAGYGLTELVLDASRCNVPQKRKRLFVCGSLGAENEFLKQALLDGLNTSSMTVRDYLGESLGVDHYYRHPRNYNRRGIFSINEPAPTVRGVNRPVPKGYLGHAGDPIKVDRDLRPLTTKERALLQTFPAEFILTGTKTDNEQMVGNAVPVNLGEYVGLKLVEYNRTLNAEREVRYG